MTVAFPELDGLGRRSTTTCCSTARSSRSTAGVPSFAALAERFHVTSHRRAVTLAAQTPATLMAFDLLRLYGVDLTQRSLADRRSTLERLELAGPHWQVPPTFADGELLRDATRDQGLEGIVSKRLSSRVPPGPAQRGVAEVPEPHRRCRSSSAAGGPRPAAPTGSARCSSAPRGRRVCAISAGSAAASPARPGSRWPGAGRAHARRTRRSPARSRGRTRSARPSSTRCSSCEVQALGLTNQGRLRQPAYRGRRPDLTPDDVSLEDVPGA